MMVCDNDWNVFTNGFDMKLVVVPVSGANAQHANSVDTAIIQPKIWVIMKHNTITEIRHDTDEEMVVYFSVLHPLVPINQTDPLYLAIPEWCRLMVSPLTR